MTDWAHNKAFALAGYQDYPQLENVATALREERGRNARCADYHQDMAKRHGSKAHASAAKSIAAAIRLGPEVRANIGRIAREQSSVERTQEEEYPKNRAQFRARRVLERSRSGTRGDPSP